LATVLRDQGDLKGARHPTQTRPEHP
jgi:hypothetical protein